MLRTPIGSRLVAALSTTVVAVAAFLVLPTTTAHAVAARYRAESRHDATSAKSAVATCPDGTVLLGAGGRIKDGNGGVLLDAIVPTRTSVEVRGVALPGYLGQWSVVAVAFCESAEMTSPRVVVSRAGSTTATCPDDRARSGSGFDLPDGVPLTGLVPDAAGRGVTVRTAYAPKREEPVAYAICAPGLNGNPGPPYHFQFDATSPLDTSPRKVVTVLPPEYWPWQRPMTGVGAEVTVVPSVPGSPVSSAEVFIDAIMPSESGDRVTVEAVRRWTGAAPRQPASPARSAGLVAAVDEDPWSVTGYGEGTDHDIYWHD